MERGRKEMNLKERSIGVNLLIPMKDLQRVDASAKKAGLSRSAWMRQVINQAIGSGGLKRAADIVRLPSRDEKVVGMCLCMCERVWPVSSFITFRYFVTRTIHELTTNSA
jgi:hypothetical protein